MFLLSAAIVWTAVAAEPTRACIADDGSKTGVCRAEAPKSGARGPRNVLGDALETCSTAPLTGFYRNGRCDTGADDRGVHVVCAEMTAAFLSFSKRRGNDLVTPAPQYRFPGLEPGQKWCLCAARYAEAARANVAPPVDMRATHAVALKTVSMETLQRFTRRADARSSSQTEGRGSNP